METIKPCPLCGSDAIVHGIHDGTGDKWSVLCTNYECMAGWPNIERTFKTREEAIEWWNDQVQKFVDNIGALCYGPDPTR